MDFGDPASIAAHAGGVATSGGLGAWLMNFLRSRAEREAAAEAAKANEAIRTQLALLQQKLDQMAVTLEKHADLGERVALLEAAVKAAHSRLDDLPVGRRRK